MKILVTGAGGFLGTALISRLLAQGFTDIRYITAPGDRQVDALRERPALREAERDEEARPVLPALAVVGVLLEVGDLGLELPQRGGGAGRIVAGNPDVANAVVLSAKNARVKKVGRGAARPR